MDFVQSDGLDFKFQNSVKGFQIFTNMYAPESMIDTERPRQALKGSNIYEAPPLAIVGLFTFTNFALTCPTNLPQMTRGSIKWILYMYIYVHGNLRIA